MPSKKTPLYQSLYGESGCRVLVELPLAQRNGNLDWTFALARKGRFVIHTLNEKYDSGPYYCAMGSRVSDNATVTTRIHPCFRTVPLPDAASAEDAHDQCRVCGAQEGCSGSFSVVSPSPDAQSTGSGRQRGQPVAHRSRQGQLEGPRPRRHEGCRGRDAGRGHEHHCSLQEQPLGVAFAGAWRRGH